MLDLLDHAIVCEGCFSKTTLAEILSQNQRAKACCPDMISKRKKIHDLLADLQSTVKGTH